MPRSTLMKLGCRGILPEHAGAQRELIAPGHQRPPAHGFAAAIQPDYINLSRAEPRGSTDANARNRKQGNANRTNLH